MSNHSQGSWVVKHEPEAFDDPWGVQVNGYWIASCYNSGADVVDNGTAEANAHLIAAAPDLLEALVSFTKSSYIRHQHPRRFAAAVSAIQKATGGSDV